MMDEENSDWKPVNVKFESVLLLHENDETADNFTGTSPQVPSENFSEQGLVALEKMVFNLADDLPSRTKFTSSPSHDVLEETMEMKIDNAEDSMADSCEEAKYQIPNSTFQNVSKRSILNFVSSLPSTTSPTPSTSHEETLKIKEEKAEDEVPLADRFLHVGQQTPSETATSVFLEDGSAFTPERIYIKIEDVFIERNVNPKEHHEFEFIDVQERGSNVKMEDDSVEGNYITKNERQQLDFADAQKVGTTDKSNNTVEFSAGSESKESQCFGTSAVFINNFENDGVKPDNPISSPSINVNPLSLTPFGERILTCERCCAGFKTESHLSTHLRRIHSDEGSISSSQCSAKFKRKGLEQDLETYSDEQDFPCSQCSARFQKKRHLKSHLQTHSDVRAFSCDQCSARFKTQIHLKYHLLTHSSERAFSCGQCSMKFKKKAELKQHFITHSAERAFSCDQCSARFKRKAHLTYHLLTHSNEKAFSCDQCSTEFKTKAELKQHLITHSNEKIFFCDQCSAQFKRKANLKYHMLTHSDERAFSCDQCSAEFKKKANLKKHLGTHSNERAFACTQCSIKFKTKDHLKQHLKTHSDMRAFSCDQCSARFKTKGSLKQHFVTHSMRELFLAPSVLLGLKQKLTSKIT